MALLALVAVSSLLACGQYVLTEHTGTPDPDSRQLPGTGVPTATMADLPTPEPTFTRRVDTERPPTATPVPTEYTTATVIAVPGVTRTISIPVGRCSRPAGTSLPDLLAEIDRLEWVRDRPTSSEDEGVAMTMDSTIEDLETLAEECPQVFRSIMGRDWMQTDIGNATWARLVAVNKILQIARVEEEAALAVMELPFLDTLEHLDAMTMEFLRDLFKAAPDDGRRLISRKDVQSTDSDALPTDFYLIYLRSQAPAVSEGLDLLQWMDDGLAPFVDEFAPPESRSNNYESAAIRSLTTLYMKSPAAFLSMVRRTWLQESIHVENYTALVNVLDFAYASPDATAQIAAMDFLDTLEEDDIRIIQDLRALKWDDRGRYRKILLNPTLLEDYFAARR